MLQVSEIEKGIVALHLPTGPLQKTALSWNRYRDENPLPTSPLADGIANVPPGPVYRKCCGFNNQ